MKRTLTILGLVFAVFALATEAGAQQVELTPHIGYRFGGGMTDDSTGTDDDFNDSETYGLTLN